MTAPAGAAPPPPPPPPPPALPPLMRRRDDRVLRGVCAAVGRSTGTDPVLWRVVVAVLVLFGGTGVVLYAAGWLLIPEQGEDASIAERVLRGRTLRRGLSTGAIIAIVVTAAVLVLGIGLDGRNGVVPLLAVAVLVYVVLRGQTPGLRLATPDEARAAVPPDGEDPGTPAHPTSAYTGAPYAAAPFAGGYPGGSYAGTYAGGSYTGTYPGGTYTAPAWTAPAWTAPPWAPPPPRARRRRSPLGLLTVSVALLVTGVLLGLHAAGADGITVGRVLAADLLVVGLGLVIGARWGRARWLALPAVLLAGALVVTASAQVPVALSAGERHWLPGAAGTYRLGVGEAVLDLGTLDPASPADTDLRAELGAGHLVVRVPAGLHLELSAQVAAGEVLVPGDQPAGGTRLTDGTRLRVTRTFGPADAPLVHLDAVIGAGQLEVRTDG